MQDCFDNIIGISKTSCACYTSEFDNDAQKSNSGLFMDQLEQSPSLEAITGSRECGSTLQEVMTQARTNAIADFKRALYQELGTRYTVRQQTYEGAIGQVVGNGYLSGSYAYAGVALEMQPTRGATVKINGIQPLFNYDGTLDVTVYKAVSTGNSYMVLGAVRMITLNTQINNPSVQAPATELILDTTDDTGKPLVYLFIYQPASGQQPKNNNTSCGCGNKEKIMQEYVRPYGINSMLPTSFPLSNRTDKLNGLLLYVEARCGTGTFLCENYNRDEFVRESMNWAILYRSVANSISGLLNSTLVSRYTLANREQMQYNVNVLGGKFQKSVAWLGEHMDMSRNDCYVCTPGITGTAYDYQKEGILL